MVCANRLFTIKFYNTNTCIVRLTNCVSVVLNPFNTKRQAMRQQPILEHLFSSNINFKGVYLQQDIITRPSIVSVHTCHFSTILISFHKEFLLIWARAWFLRLNQSMLEVDRDTLRLIEQSITLIKQSRFYKCCIFIL